MIASRTYFAKVVPASQRVSVPLVYGAGQRLEQDVCAFVSMDLLKLTGLSGFVLALPAPDLCEPVVRGPKCYQTCSTRGEIQILKVYLNRQYGVTMIMGVKSIITDFSSYSGTKSGPLLWLHERPKSHNML